MFVSKKNILRTIFNITIFEGCLKTTTQTTTPNNRCLNDVGGVGAGRKIPWRLNRANWGVCCHWSRVTMQLLFARCYRWRSVLHNWMRMPTCPELLKNPLLAAEDFIHRVSIPKFTGTEDYTQRCRPPHHRCADPNHVHEPIKFRLIAWSVLWQKSASRVLSLPPWTKW